LQNDIANFRDHNRVKHQRPLTGLLENGVDLIFHRSGTAFVFHERQRDAIDGNRELRHHRMAQHFGGDRRTIGNIKNVAIDSIIHFAHSVYQM